MPIQLSVFMAAAAVQEEVTENKMKVVWHTAGEFQYQHQLIK